MNATLFTGNLVDVFTEKIYLGEITISSGRINTVRMLASDPDPSLPFILPGFIDSHVHIESSMLVPSEFAKLAVVHGTVATVSDPHEIANVCGQEGVQFMIENGKTVNFKFNFGAPSCVPATIFETAGADLDTAAVASLLARTEISYLSEMMNFPGVVHNDPSVINKINAAKHVSKPIDGHAPGLSGEALVNYVAAGISTDHECFTRAEALEKLSLGMKIIIREGSAARNFDALIDLLNDYPDEIMFCSDDKHPDSLVSGHINQLCQRAAKLNVDSLKIIKAACINPVLHYRLQVGMLRPGDAADFIIVKDLKNFEVLNTFINGVCVAANGKLLIHTEVSNTINNFHASAIDVSQISCDPSRYLLNGFLPVIEALDGQLITNRIDVAPKIVGNNIVSDIENDILKLIVVNRYSDAPPAIGFIKNFGLKTGAIASSVAHDSHNIIATGCDDESIQRAVNLVIREKGGISIAAGAFEKVLPLPVAGLMSNADGYKVANDYIEMDRLAKENGSTLSAPYMTLSFMALLVIPSLKLSDRGLFDGVNFRFIYS